MKTNKLSIPLALTAAFVGLIACAVSCAKKSSAPPTPIPSLPPPPVSNSAAETTNLVAATNAPAPAAAAPAVTNAAAVDITNLPPAETTTKAPDTIGLTDTNLPGHTTVVEMPANAAVAPTNFFPPEISSSNLVCCLSPVDGDTSTNFFLRLRAGYEHMYHGDNNDSYRASAKLYAYGDGLRATAGKNGWLIPDASAEIASGLVPKPDQDPHPGSDDGLSFRADFTWPWARWTSLMLANSNSVCPFCQPLALGFGPTVNVGFDHLYNESRYRLARYAGARLTFNRSGFIEYTVGGTDGLDSTRQQVVTELPFYESRDGEVRYYLRGLWNHGTSSRPDVLEGGIFLEMPFTTLLEPAKWGDLIPFAQ